MRNHIFPHHLSQSLHHNEQHQYKSDNHCRRYNNSSKMHGAAMDVLRYQPLWMPYILQNARVPIQKMRFQRHTLPNLQPTRLQILLRENVIKRVRNKPPLQMEPSFYRMIFGSVRPSIYCKKQFFFHLPLAHLTTVRKLGQPFQQVFILLILTSERKPPDRSSHKSHFKTWVR